VKRLRGQRGRLLTPRAAIEGGEDICFTATCSLWLLPQHHQLLCQEGRALSRPQTARLHDSGKCRVFTNAHSAVHKLAHLSRRWSSF